MTAIVVTHPIASLVAALVLGACVGLFVGAVLAGTDSPSGTSRGGRAA